MTNRRFEVAPIVRRRAAVEGNNGWAWVESLPAVVAYVEDAWSITVGEQLRGGTASVTARATTASGTPAVLKIAVPDPSFGRQLRTLLAAQGRGYVTVLAHDISRHAVLMPALGNSLDRSGLAPEGQLAVLADTLKLAWQMPRPAGADGVAVDKANGLAALVSTLWSELDRPCSERVIEKALGYARRRAAAFAPERCVVVHGDAAAPNLLQASPETGTGYLFVDPDGFVGDPAYDLGVALRDWTPQLLAGDAVSVARGYCRVLAARSGRSEAEIWEWGYLERVSTGLFALSLDAAELARPLLATAAALA